MGVACPSLENGESRSQERLWTMSTHQCGLLSDETGEPSQRNGSQTQRCEDKTGKDLLDYSHHDPAQEDGDDGLNPL